MGRRANYVARAMMNRQMNVAGRRYNERQGNRGIGRRRGSNARRGSDK